MLIDISYFTLLYSKIVVINYICICFADFKKKVCLENSSPMTKTLLIKHIPLPA